MGKKQIDVSSRSTGDIAHSLTKAGLSAIPILGGAAVELFQNVVQPPLEKRRAEWMEKVGQKLQDLEENGLDLDGLRENEQFISAAMYASQLALRTHNREKLEALRNAVANVAIGQAPEEALQHIFFNLVDTLTELHVQLLRVFQSPEPPPGLSLGGLSNVLEHNMPELRGKEFLYQQLWRDLYSRGLINTEGLNTTMSGSGLAEKRTTGLGDAFVRFIAEPAI
ncbi:hypothetical protein [Porticoccus sp.]